MKLNKTATLLSENLGKYEREKVERNKIMTEIKNEIKVMSVTIKL